MKYLKRFNESIDESEIHEICRRYNITNYTINDGLVDVDGSVDLGNMDLKELPLKFGKVKDHFTCRYNKLKSLIGCPNEVGGSFYCTINELTSLEGCPDKVGHGFFCNFNQLSNLKWSPSEIGGTFNCEDNSLTSLEGSPKYIPGSFSCKQNKLKTLEGCPTKVDGNFNCSFNETFSLSAFPKVGGNIICYRNPSFEVYSIFPTHQSFMDSLDYNYFREGNKINKIRLTQALIEIGLECPENIEGYIWE